LIARRKVLLFCEFFQAKGVIAFVYTRRRYAVYVATVIMGAGAVVLAWNFAQDTTILDPSAHTISLVMLVIETVIAGYLVWITVDEEDDIGVDKINKKWHIDRFRCISCGYCVEVCPQKCLALAGDHGIPTVTKDKETF
jgi:hypothetical protein